jgi:argininosuccinate lyase
MTPAGRPAGTGRIIGALSAKAQRLYYGEPDDAAAREALSLIAWVDRAHLVMLAERGIVPREKAGVLLRCVAEMEAAGFESVVSVPRPRGLYLAWEQAIIDRCGPVTGGCLHTGRSRNDLNATTTLLTLRDLGMTVVAEGGRLVTALLSVAGHNLQAVMAIHTHYQPAMPITYGYYLTGVALALHRELDRMLQAVASIRRCPLGAHAVAGTDLELDTTRTATLLGFESGPLHAIDAIASRDIALHVVGIASGLVTTVSRLATDLQLWSTSELGYLHFPDWLVGSSSAMPQKRNAFLLEYLKGRPSSVVGAWVTAIMATKCAPFTNSIEVGTEAVAPLSQALRTTRDILAMTALVVAGAQLQPDVSRAAAARSFVDATCFANELVRRGIPFREAHERIGVAVLRALELDGVWPPEDFDQLDLMQAVVRAKYGGGPGSAGASLAAAWRLRHQMRQDLLALRQQQLLAADRLRKAAEGVCGD